LCLLVPEAVRAQDLDEALSAAADTTAGEAGADSTTGPSGPTNQLQDTPPAYNTSYNVDRTTTAWLQNLKFGTRVGFLQFTNTTNFNITDDTAYDQKARRGDNQLLMNWLMLRQVPINSNFTFRRETLTRPGEERETNVATLNATATFSPRLAGVRNTFTLGGGYDRTSLFSLRNADRTRTVDAGLQGNMSWRGIWRASSKLNVNANVRQLMSNKTSQFLNVDGSSTSAPTKRLQRSLSLTTSFNPMSWSSGSLTLTDNQGEDESPLAQAGQGSLEKKTTHQRSLTGQVTLQPRNGTNVTSNFSVYNNSLRLTQRLDSASDSDGYRWDVGIKTRILQADVEGTLSGSTDNLRPQTSPTTRTVTSNFDGRAVRPMSPKITLQLDWLLRANQLFFSNLDPKNQYTPEEEMARMLDRDEFRTKLQPTLIYRPGRKWITTTTLIRSTVQQVQLNPARASQTRNDEDYTAEISLTYNLSDRTNISQIYSIKALYTSYRYNPKSDRLLRTQNVTTSLESAVTEKVFLALEHRFLRQDSGPFDIENGARIFARSQRSYSQELTASVDYQIIPWVVINLSSRMLRTDDIAEVSQARSTYRNLEVVEGVNVNRNVGLGMTLQGRAFHTRSNVRPSYWTITSNLTKQF